jgi:hypothetical protein
MVSVSTCVVIPYPIPSADVSKLRWCRLLPTGLIRYENLQQASQGPCSAYARTLLYFSPCF